MTILDKIKKNLVSESNRINDILATNLKVPEELINDISEYIIARGGKKIRPMLTLLTAKMLSGAVNDTSIYLASSVELIHIATLLHDDVIDAGAIRHGKITPNKIWDNKTAILSGDFLFTAAFKLMVRSQNLDALTLLSDSASMISRGEIMQHSLHTEAKILSLPQYTSIIEQKTAQLFAASTACGAISVNQSSEIVNNLTEFGFAFGKIFQISDDMLDYFGSTDKTGKNIGQDFYESKVTLPVILAYKASTDIEKEWLEKGFFKNNKNESDLKTLLDLMGKYNIHDKMIKICNDIAESAKKSLHIIEPGNIYQILLIELLEHLVSRKR